VQQFDVVRPKVTGTIVPSGIEYCYSARMHPVLLDLLQRQQRDGFPDLAGTEIAATIPISDRLINELIASSLPSGGKVREILVQAEEGNRVTARVRLSASNLLPAIPVTLAIEDQPTLPERPQLGLRLSQASGFVAMAASALPSMVTLPPGISLEGDRIRLDIRKLLAERHLEELLEHLTHLRVNTRAGAIILEVRASINPK
jgi:hypothetical protein